jgi:hypothetical protein
VIKNQGAGPPERIAYLRRHVWVMSFATLVAVFSSLIWLAANNRWREKLWLPGMVGVVIALGLMTYGAWFGGETIYRQGTSVALITYPSAAEGEEAKAADAKPVLEVPKEPQIRMDPKHRYSTVVKYFLAGELQAHIITAGLAFAAALGALGLSFRRMSTLRAAETADLAAIEQEGTIRSEQPRRVTDDVSVVRSINPDAQIDPQESRLPVVRFWILAMLVAIATAVLGYWVMTTKGFFKPSEWKDFLDSVTPSKDANRHFAHLVLGGALAVIALLFIIAALAMPRRPFPLMILGTLLVLIVAAQVWIGVLMTFDSEMEGPLTHFTAEQKGNPEPHGSEGTPHQEHEKGKETSMLMPAGRPAIA